MSAARKAIFLTKLRLKHLVCLQSRVLGLDLHTFGYIRTLFQMPNVAISKGLTAPPLPLSYGRGLSFPEHCSSCTHTIIAILEGSDRHYPIGIQHVSLQDWDVQAETHFAWHLSCEICACGE